MQNLTLMSYMPDLVITAVSDEWVDEENAKKYKYIINYTIKNIGDATSSESTTSIKIDGTEVTTDTVPELASGENCTKTVGPSSCLCDQTVNIAVCADRDNAVEEINETNNCLEHEKSFGPCMPDLKITNHSVEWVDRLNKTFNVTYTVKNVGNGSASTSTTNISVVNDDAPVPELTPGKNYTSTVGPFQLTGNKATITICADCYDTVIESDEDNNCCSDAIGIPQLTISIYSMDWVDEQNKVYNITYKVHNSGGAASTNLTKVYVYIDGNLSMETDHPKTFQTMSTYVLLEPFTMTGTSDTISVCVEWEDGKNCVEEVFVSDNQMPDLVIENQSVLWVDRLSRAFNVTYTVKNIGNGSANSSTTNISVVNYDDPVPALSSGESYTNTVGPFNATFDEGNFYQISITICADCYSTVTESDETNNCASDGIGIPYLNISIESVDWVELNKTYNISYKVLNSGGAASTNVTRAYVYIDGNPNASATDKVGIMPKPPIDNPTCVMGLFEPFMMTGTSDTIKVCVEWEDGKNCVEEVFGYQATSVFDTGTGTYPGISGTHNGTIIPDEDIEVNRLYTYACAGTGGHTEYVRIWNESENVYGQGNWSGYPGDYHNVTISPAITLLQGHTYNYTITTGSYPQIVHAKNCCKVIPITTQ
jgi:subtilase family serine protease